MPSPEIVQLRPETIEWATWEGSEIRLKPGDTREGKIANSIFGSYGQQLLIDKTGGRRVTKAEVPDFAYDIKVDHDRLTNYLGWGYDIGVPIANVEIKDLRAENRSWVSFHDGFIGHAIKCARRRRFHYLVAYYVNVLDEKKYIAEVQLCAAVSPIALLRDRYFHPSKPSFKPMHYFRPRDIHEDNVGRIF